MSKKSTYLIIRHVFQLDKINLEYLKQNIMKKTKIEEKKNEKLYR